VFALLALKPAKRAPLICSSGKPHRFYVVVKREIAIEGFDPIYQLLVTYEADQVP
jgi:hypothetical protein